MTLHFEDDCPDAAVRYIPIKPYFLYSKLKPEFTGTIMGDLMTESGHYAIVEQNEEILLQFQSNDWDGSSETVLFKQ